MATQRNTLEQGRASFAYTCAQKSQSEDYRTAAKKLPMYIKTNGLGAAMAFMKTKNNTLYGDVQEWLRKDECTVKPLMNWSSGLELSERLVNIDSAAYRAVTVEVLAFLNWLRRFADGFKK